MDWNFITYILDSNLFWCILGAFFSLIISAFFYFISLNRKKLIIEITTNALISESISQLDNISITYNNENIDSLYSSIIKIHNTGNTIIEKNDFAKKDPLAIMIHGDFILNKNKQIIQISNGEDYDFNCILDNRYTHPGVNNAIVSYDFIPRKEVIVLTVFHTNYLNIMGKLKNGKIIVKQSLFEDSKYETGQYKL